MNKSSLLGFALFAATAGAVLALPSKPMATPLPTTLKPIASAAQQRPKVEVVFVLDTTGSMSGLIQAAKENIWSIASSMASAKPTPEIRMGLVAFRDRGDQYVTRVIDLSSDLDSMYAQLMDLQADGGGDGPESVNQALADAVNKVSWSQDKSAYKVVFLVGDAPPHMDYPDEVKYPDTLKTASARGIVINAIQAGADPSTRAEWQEIARLNQGAFFQVEQSGNAVAVATPFDEKLAALSHDLDGTRLYYGDEEVRVRMEAKVAASDKLHEEGSVASKARRAAFNAAPAGASNLLGESELVDDVSSGRVDLSKVAPEKLPEELRGMKKDEQAQVIGERAKQRGELTAQIRELSDQRQNYIDAKLKEAGGADKSLDAQVHGAVRAQAAAKGLEYEAKAKY